jgi:hypothetical protein
VTLSPLDGWPARPWGAAALCAALSWTGVVFCAMAVIDPQLALALPSGLALVGFALPLALARGRNWRALLFPTALAVALGLSVVSQPQFRADSREYYVQLRSLFFDRDLDLKNDRGALVRPGRRRRLSRIVESANSRIWSPIGPAVLWSPFYAASHMYVKAASRLGVAKHTADGYSDPYRRAPVLGTVACTLGGAWLLGAVLVRRYGLGAGSLAVAGAALASPIAYYVFVVPAMAHGLAFATAGALLWAWEAARRAPSLRTWAVLGVLLGLVCLVRWQGAVYLLLVAPLGLLAVVRGVRMRWLWAAAGLAALAFAPQMIAWKLNYGSFLTIPQGRGFVEWSAPHLVDVLVSADHGLLTWSPIALVGVVGLLGGLRPDPLLNGGALAVFFATAWVNAGVADWAAGDAYGARRFDLVFPLVAVGLGQVIDASLAAVKRNPQLPAMACVFLLVVWNLGQIALFRQHRYPQALPLERVVADQARQARLLAQDLGGAVAGDAGRALAYKMLSAEYLFSRFNRGGVVRLAFADQRELRGGWSPGYCGPGEVPFRWALPPESCLLLPVDGRFEMDLTLRARAPAATQPQTATIRFNDRVIAVAPVPERWAEIRASVPETNVTSGENWLCLRFANSVVAKGGARLAAAVASVEVQ